MTTTEQVAATHADVELRVPAQSAYVSVLRTTTAGLAARLDFTIDDIEDLRIAVGEACALVLPTAPAQADLTASFRLNPGQIDVRVQVPAEPGTAPDFDSFAWQVLETLAHRAAAEVVDGVYTVELTMSTLAGEL